MSDYEILNSCFCCFLNNIILFVLLNRRLSMLEKLAWWIEALWERNKLKRKLKKLP